jgi:hypothetical protein
LIPVLALLSNYDQENCLINVGTEGFTKAAADKLFVKLSYQRRFWPDSYAVILIGEPFPPNTRFHQDFIRVIPPNRAECLRGPSGIDTPSDDPDAMRQIWDQLPKLGTIFHYSDFDLFGGQRDDRGRAFQDDADFITPAIRELGRF